MNCTHEIASRSCSDHDNARFTHWAARYVGTPYRPGGRAPGVGLDCWGLVWRYYRDILGVWMPDVPAVDHARLIQYGAEALAPWGFHWEEIRHPEEGCVVAMGFRDSPHHIGVWTDEPPGYVIHALIGHSVVAQTLAQVRRSGIRCVRFYRLAGAPRFPSAPVEEP